MKRSDYWLLAGFCLVVYGVGLVSGRPLTMHEAVLPECAREMQVRGDWLIPTSGGRPWLHRPPLPHWTLLLINLPLGEMQQPWQVRLGPLLTGMLATLISAWLAQRWFGRGLGLLTGFMLATSFQFVRYAWLAEEDMFLCAIVVGALACFAKLEVPANGDEPAEPRFSFFGWQSWPLLGFFALFGLSNLVKGLIFGPLMIAVPAGLYLIATGSPKRFVRYFWFWGWVAMALTGAWWPAWIYQRFPDVLEMWQYDYGGRLNGGYLAEPWWYYAVVLLWAMLPWTPCVFVGLWATRRDFRGSPPARFIWCWALGVLLFFSIPDGKHHHYFIHCMPAWGMLAALGLKKWWQWVGTLEAKWRRPWLIPAAGLPVLLVFLVIYRSRLPDADWLVPGSVAALFTVLYGCGWCLNQRQPWRAGIAAFGLFGLVFLAAHLFIAQIGDEGRQDAAFLAELRTTLDPSVPLLVNADLRTCQEVNRILFDLQGRARAIHNLSFLLDEDHAETHVLLITQASDEPLLARLGQVRLAGKSVYSRREANAGERLSLFEIWFSPDLPRFPAHVYIAQQQIKQREPGPFLGGVAPDQWDASLTVLRHNPGVWLQAHGDLPGHADPEIQAIPPDLPLLTSNAKRLAGRRQAMQSP